LADQRRPLADQRRPLADQRRRLKENRFHHENTKAGEKVFNKNFSYFVLSNFRAFVIGFSDFSAIFAPLCEIILFLRHSLFDILRFAYHPVDNLPRMCHGLSQSHPSSAL
jgi:hypothetical protein